MIKKSTVARATSVALVVGVVFLVVLTNAYLLEIESWILALIANGIALGVVAINLRGSKKRAELDLQYQLAKQLNYYVVTLTEDIQGSEVDHVVLTYSKDLVDCHDVAYRIARSFYDGDTEIKDDHICSGVRKMRDWKAQVIEPYVYSILKQYHQVVD